MGFSLKQYQPESDSITTERVFQRIVMDIKTEAARAAYFS
jgi:hypothetical protein